MELKYYFREDEFCSFISYSFESLESNLEISLIDIPFSSTILLANSLGGLENIEVESVSGNPITRLYGRTISLVYDSKILSDEIYLESLKLLGDVDCERKIPEDMLDRCIEYKIFPMYNYVDPRRTPWHVDSLVPYNIWRFYTDSEKELMISQGNKLMEEHKITRCINPDMKYFKSMARLYIMARGLWLFF
jgi:hypothetical protein